MNQLASSQDIAGQAVPLCVDLDGTLIRTDILWESVVQLLRRPLVALRAILALALHGKARFKSVLAEAITVDPASLPYREDVLEFVRLERAGGRSVVLATATHRAVAQRIADHLGLFDRVFATEAETNLAGVHKLAALESAYGRRGFDYIGDSAKDLPVLSMARKALLVCPSKFLLREATAAGNVALTFTETRPAAKTIARALRLHQWAKNILLAVPLLAAHRVLDAQAWIDVAAAFFGFGLVASSTYLVNDLVDLGADRTHSKKRFRPLASGHLSIQAGLLLAIAAGSLGFAIAAAFLPPVFVAYLGAYVALTLWYSFDLKRRLLVDVLALAILYTLRILAGGAAIGVVVSEWLSMFSLFIFLSLAFLKRVIELEGDGRGARVSGRGYLPADLDTTRAMGISAGLVSVLVLSLYISSPAVSQLYRYPQALWLMCPLLLYWIGRIWLLAGRGEVHHDPVVFALLDWQSYVIGVLGLIVAFVASAGLPGAAG